MKALQVGITGGIGTGKTTICRIFETLGVPVYEADSRSKWLLDNHSGIKKDLIETFGEASYQNGKYNRAYLAQLVFQDKSKTELINKIVHPRVFEDYQDWWQNHANYPYLLRESAILFESGGARLSDKVIVVSTPIEIRLQRIKKRDAFRTEAEIRAIMDKQMPEEEKIQKADFVIFNDDTQLVIPQVLLLHQKLKNKNF